MRSLAVCSLFASVSGACGDGLPVRADVAAAGSWRLDSGTVRDKSVPLVAGYRITLGIEGEAMSGRAACNRYGGRIRFDGDSVSLGSSSEPRWPVNQR